MAKPSGADDKAPPSDAIVDLPVAVSGPAVASALGAIARLLEEGAGKRPNNRRGELFPYTPQVLRNVAGLLRKYADVAETREAPAIAAAPAEPTGQPIAPPAIIPGQREASDPPAFSLPAAVDVTDDEDGDVEDAPRGSDPDRRPDWRSPHQAPELDALEDGGDDELAEGADVVEVGGITFVKIGSDPFPLNPGEPAANGHYAPGTSGYADEQARLAASQGKASPA